jgi:MFS transporter, DHA1 family, multidrug resistance protein
MYFDPAVTSRTFTRVDSILTNMINVLFTCVYTALIYAIYYSFGEASPIVYIGVYSFNLGQMGVTLLSITASVTLALPSYWTYTYYIVKPEIMRKGRLPPERDLIPAHVVSFLLPICPFMFG